MMEDDVFRRNLNTRVTTQKTHQLSAHSGVSLWELQWYGPGAAAAEADTADSIA
jgi:hypothetical protein